MPGIESFGRQSREEERAAIEARLRGANLEWVRDCFASMFQQAKEEGDAKGGQYAFKTEYLTALRPFMENPTMENAITLLKAEPSMFEPFEESKKLSILLDKNEGEERADGGHDTQQQPPQRHPKTWVFRPTPASEPCPDHINPLLRTKPESASAASQNARQMPVIEAGVATIELGVFTLLSRRFESRGGPAAAAPLAFCVTRTLFSRPIEQTEMKAFSLENTALIEQEARAVFADKELSEPVLLAYAALMIALGWETSNPFNPTATSLIERASENGAEIPNIVRMWGAEAIVRFFRAAQEFMVSSLTK